MSILDGNAGHDLKMPGGETSSDGQSSAENSSSDDDSQSSVESDREYKHL